VRTNFYTQKNYEESQTILVFQMVHGTNGLYTWLELTNWWSAAALGRVMTGGGGVPHIFHRRRQRGYMVGGGGGVRPDERALK